MMKQIIFIATLIFAAKVNAGGGGGGGGGGGAVGSSVPFLSEPLFGVFAILAFTAWLIRKKW